MTRLTEQSIQLCTLRVRGGGRCGKQAREIRVGILVARSLMALGLTGLHEGVEVKFVGVALSVDFGHDVLVVVIAQGPGKLVVVHVGFGLSLAPFPRDLVGIRELEFAVGSLPRDDGVVA